MSKVLTFSTDFPVGHRRRGYGTDFVESIWKSLTTNLGYSEPLYFFKEYSGLKDAINLKRYADSKPKKHTIRAGSRWKAGEYFSPRIWSGAAYRSKQITLAPDIKIVRTAIIEITEHKACYINGKLYAAPNCWDKNAMMYLANNDGFTGAGEEMEFWFNKLPFKGQIIIWDDTNLKY